MNAGGSVKHSEGNLSTVNPVRGEWGGTIQSLEAGFMVPSNMFSFLQPFDND